MTDSEKASGARLLPRWELVVDSCPHLGTIRFALSTMCSLTIWLAATIVIGGAGEPNELSIAHDEYVYMIRFSPDGKTLATAAGDNVARVWDWSTRKPLYTLEHEAAVYAVDFSPTDDLLATGSGDGKVTLWSLSNGTEVVQKKEHDDAVYCLVFSPDGTRLASIGGDGKKGDTQCRLWSVPALKITNVLPGHQRPAYGVIFGPPASLAGQSLVTSGGDKLIYVNSLVTGQRRTWTGHTSDVYRCCFSPDGQQLASTSQDGSVRLWNVATGEMVKTLFQGKDPTYDVAYSRDGKILAAVGDDGFVRYWNTLTHELLAETKTDKEGLYSLVFTPDQTWVITGGVRGKIHECPVPQITLTDGLDQRNVDKDAADASRP